MHAKHYNRSLIDRIMFNEASKTTISSCSPYVPASYLCSGKQDFKPCDGCGPQWNIVEHESHSNNGKLLVHCIVPIQVPHCTHPGSNQWENLQICGIIQPCVNCHMPEAEHNVAWHGHSKVVAAYVAVWPSLLCFACFRPASIAAAIPVYLPPSASVHQACPEALLCCCSIPFYLLALLCRL